jgi:hypothetical protein
VLTPAVPYCTSPGALRAASVIAARSAHGASALPTNTDSCLATKPIGTNAAGS